MSFSDEKVIIILSESNDSSTTSVIKWIMYLGGKYLRVNGGVNSIYLSTKKGKVSLVIKNHEITLNQIKSLWFRRDHLRLKYKNREFNNKGLSVFLDEENYWFTDYITWKLRNKKTINTQYTLEINKLIVLEKAREIGFLVPKYFFTNKKSEIISKRGYMITKVINGNPNIRLSNNLFGAMKTDLIDINNIPKYFSPSFIQEYIEKRYELRIFYLHGKIWSMAIFSQKDEKTKYDFRNYNRENPNRVTPFKLPKNIRDMVINLMENLKLNSGSIDMIVTNNFDYYFLEVNPIGQFGIVSLYCNYNLEREIAKFLIDK